MVGAKDKNIIGNTYDCLSLISTENGLTHLVAQPPVVK